MGTNIPSKNFVPVSYESMVPNIEANTSKKLNKYILKG